MSQRPYLVIRRGRICKGHGRKQVNQGKTEVVRGLVTFMVLVRHFNKNTDENKDHPWNSTQGKQIVLGSGLRYY